MSSKFSDGIKFIGTKNTFWHNRFFNPTLDENIQILIFSPKKIAIVGASSDINKASARPQRYLFKHNFQGKVYLSKNAVFSKQVFEKMYPSYRKIKELKKKYDPECLFLSKATKRLLTD